MEKIRKEIVIMVKFFQPVDGETEFFFGSLSAIYDRFTPAQIGCTLKTLWESKIEVGKPKVTSTCLITKNKLHRKQQKEK